MIVWIVIGLALIVIVKKAMRATADASKSKKTVEEKPDDKKKGVSEFGKKADEAGKKLHTWLWDEILSSKMIARVISLAGYVALIWILRVNFKEDWIVWEKMPSFTVLLVGLPVGVLVLSLGKGFSRVVIGTSILIVVIWGFFAEWQKTPEYQVNAEKARREKAEKAVAKQNLSWSLKRPAEDYTWVTLQPNEWLTLRNPGGGNIKGFSGEIGSPTASIIVRITFADGGVKEYLESYTKPLVLSGEVVSISLRSGKKYPVTYGYMFTH